ncbi:hypothetical protein C8Q80DRAFT_127749 [Daedaleopsis nitida]|nr:hypothetical protein C8Q80DRAFT_127749 [Daedaleopsis nitida]
MLPLSKVLIHITELRPENTQKVVWEWHVRYCSECIMTMSYDHFDVCQTLSKLDLNLVLLVRTLFSTYEVPPRTCSGYGRWPYKYNRVHKLEVHAVEASLREAGDPLPVVCRDAIMATQWKHYTEQQQSIKQCMEWHSRQKARQNTDLSVRKEERFTEIMARLRGSGWDKEIDFLGERGLCEMAALPGVRSASKLTKKEWKKVMAAVGGYLRKTRKRRIDREPLHIPRTAGMDCRPGYVNLALMNECKAIVDVPGSVNISREDFPATVQHSKLRLRSYTDPRYIH